MSKVVLISPPEQHILMEAGDRPYLGLLYLAGSLKRNNHQVIISDLNHDSYNDLNKKLVGVDFIGMITFTPYFEWINNFSQHLKQNYPQTKLIAGGPHATVEPNSLRYFDYVVCGEGEKAIVDIVEGKVRDRIIRYDYEENLDNLPQPYDNVNYEYGVWQEGRRTATLMTSRSCPYNCCFCTKGILGKYRMHSVDRVIKEIKQVVDLGYDSIYFLDDNFTFDKQRAIEIARRIVDEGIKITFRVMSRTDQVDEELIIELKKAGLRSISFGLEHFDDNVLRMINKGETVKSHLNAIEIAKKFSLKIRGSFIVNLPGATKQTIYKTLEMAKELDIDYCDWYPLIAYPGTPLWNNPEEFNVKIKKDINVWQTQNKSNVDIGVRNMTNIIADIRQRWKQHKGMLCPWESER